MDFRSSLFSQHAQAQSIQVPQAETSETPSEPTSQDNSALQSELDSVKEQLTVANQLNDQLKAENEQVKVLNKALTDIITQVAKAEGQDRPKVDGQ